MNLSTRIHDLLFDHDCVIVPRFGGFLVHYKGAYVDEARKLVHPPGKEVGFNKQLNRNDGLLTDAVAKRENLRYEQAAATIATQVDAWQHALDNDGRLELKGIGTFWNDAAKNLRFEPDPRSNFLKDAYGLRPVAAVPVAKAAVVAPAPVGPVVRKLEPIVEPITEGTSGRRVVLWTASAAAAVLFAFAAWMLNPTGVGNGQQLGGWLSGLKQEPAVYVARTSPALVQLPTDDSALVLPSVGSGVQRIDVADGTALNVDMGLPAPAVPDTTHVGTAPLTPAGSVGGYTVMGGCFAVRENADNYIMHLRGRGFDAALIDEHKGLWRVAIGSFADKSSANEALAAARKEEAPEAWLLRK